MNSKELYGSRFINAADLGEQAITTIIQAVVVEEIDEDGGRKKAKLAIQIPGAEKLLIVNSTNRDRIAAAYGDETDNWTGKGIRVFKGKVKFGGKFVDGVIISPATSEQVTTPVQTRTQTEQLPY